MKHEQFRIVLPLFFLTAFLCVAQDKAVEYGTIRGWVRDAKNQPVGGAQFNIFDPQSLSPVPRRTESDVAGYFEIKKVPPGVHNIVARKESAGFANTMFLFSAVGTPPMTRVELHRGEDLGPIILDVGRPHGRLICRAVSAVSGAPVAIRFRFSLLSDPKIFLQSITGPDGTFEKLVPPVPFAMEINDVEGKYQTLHISEIAVSEETTKEMTVKLTPKPQGK